TLHIDEPTPHVDWTSGAVELLTEQRPWPRTDRPRRSAVSSFGISGTNAHIILEQTPVPDTEQNTQPAPTPLPTPVPGAGVVPWILSAKSADALREQAGNLAAFVKDRPETEPSDVGFSLATGRSVFEHRAVVLGSDREELLAGLRALVEDRPVA
ncbi:ketoacyl-synthetase C-terminal extension domain-containing protein, partial [Streptomyces sp. CLV115]|uniref:CurL C-terminal domain-containing protein n=1 Tax=Streptomyces sp. CLV115 TaxID=3138502 RepID=UPI00313E4362